LAGLATKKEKPKDARGTLRRILAYVMEYRLTLAVIMVLVIIGNVLSLLGPKLAGKAISAAQRQQALGNAIALPCAEYIMAGIKEVLARPP